MPTSRHQASPAVYMGYRSIDMCSCIISYISVRHTLERNALLTAANKIIDTILLFCSRGLHFLHSVPIAHCVHSGWCVRSVPHSPSWNNTPVCPQQLLVGKEWNWQHCGVSGTQGSPRAGSADTRTDPPAVQMEGEKKGGCSGPLLNLRRTGPSTGGLAVPSYQRPCIHIYTMG